jgi:hypothetical protein
MLADLSFLIGQWSTSMHWRRFAHVDCFRIANGEPDEIWDLLLSVASNHTLCRHTDRSSSVITRSGAVRATNRALP